MTLHVVGAGLAGLAAAIEAARRGARVVVWEAAKAAGGRCRSWHDAVLERTIDNGAHVVLGANRAVRRYLDLLDAGDRLRWIEPAAIPFLDLRSFRRWNLRPGRPPPGCGPADVVSAIRLLVAGADARVAELCPPARPAFATLWEPLCTAVLNTPPAQAAARPLGRVLRATLLAGEAASRPAIAAESLSHAFVEPALAALSRAGVELRLGMRVVGVEEAGGAVVALHADGARVALEPGDGVVLALAPWDAERLLAWLDPPLAASPIVNAHFRLPAPPSAPPLLGLVGGVAQWLVTRGDVTTAVVSAADGLLDAESDSVAALLWRDAAPALGLARTPLPPHRVVKERRATLRQTPAVEAARPAAQTRLANLALAGDWVRTGLPCTIEGALESGFAAAGDLIAKST